MRRVSSLLVTTSILVMGAASPALAKAQPVTPPDPNATAQQNPATPTQNADAPAGNSIVVTGLRRSMQSARNIKRNSDQVVDAVVAEDIGKLPDITVSDTAARIPGIQVERAGGEANRVLIRGLDNVYYTTTYNSRELFTAETRSVALQDFPAGAVAAIEAFKTSTANLIEPGIAGLVNVRSRRPFDFKGFELSGSVWALRPNQSRDVSVNGNLLLSDRWETGNGGEFGALINFSYTRMHYKDSIRRHGFWIADLAGGRSPDFPEIHYNEGERWRPSINGALQYRKDNLELYAEGLWQGYRERQLDSMWAQPLWGGASYSNLTFRPGTNQIVSGTVTSPGNCCGVDGEAWGFKGATHRATNTYQFAVGGSYNTGPLRISADLAHTTSHFELRTESVDYQIGTHNYSVNWYTGYPDSITGPTFQVVGLDPTNPANYQYRGFYEDWHDPRGKDWQGRLDFEFDPRLDFIPKIRWGARYVDRDASDQAGDFYWNARGLQRPISSVPLTYELIPPAFRGDDHPPFPTSWLAPTYNSIWDNLTAFRQFNINLVGGGSVNGPPVNPSRSYTINEKSLAGYGQLDFRFDAGGDTSIDGILGLRVVRSRDNITGTIAELSGPTAINVTNRYTDWLPNANLNVHFGRQWVFRLAATKTRTRPRFQDLNPALNLAPPIAGCNAQTVCIRTGSGGNPFLKPFTSANYDASLEYYFSPTGFASVSAFHRHIKGFIANQTFTYPDPSAPGVTLQISGPYNTNNGKIDGFEAQIRTFFDWDWVPNWAHSFGIDANYTHINARAVFDVLGHPLWEPIPDVSKWAYNITGMYERGPLSVRLSYNRRGKYPEGGLTNDGNFTRQGLAHPSSRLDLSTSYNWNDRFTLFADWTNILGRPFQKWNWKMKVTRRN